MKYFHTYGTGFPQVIHRQVSMRENIYDNFPVTD